MTVSLEVTFAILAVCIAGVFRGFSGFGTGMILVPCLSLIYEPVVAVVTVVLLELIPAVQLFKASLAKCHWQTVVPMALISSITVPLGAHLLITFDANTLRVLIAIMVIMTVIVLSSGWRYKGETGIKTSAMAGLSSGIITGATSLGGLPVILYYLSSQLTTQVARASMIIFLFMTTVVTLAIYANQGIITSDIIVRSGWLAPAFIIAIWIGGSLFGKVSETLFRKVILTLLTGVSFLMLLS